MGFRAKLTEKAEQQKNTLKKAFFKDLGREITEQELDTYLDLFKEGLTNFFTYVEMLKNGS